MSRGRGRGRVRFGGSRDSMLADIMDETREDLGLSYAQMELLHAEEGTALYPPLELPQPEALTDSEAYLIQRQRLLAHKLEGLYHHPWEAEASSSDAAGRKQTSDSAAFVHVTVPETQKANEVYVPEELQGNSLSGSRTAAARGSMHRGIVQPRAFETVFKTLEAQEKKIAADKAKASEQEAEDGMIDEAEEDLGDDMNDYTYDYYDSDAVSQEGDEEVFF
uniref:DNA-directed RNA polymerase III subunit n=1 Tax=Hyaloperonospora arabidopsidis (strain Emoy2) TaxID=559515 RepID=M4B8Q2_HYAAE